MLRRIFSYMKEYKKYAWLALICIGVEVVLEIMVPKLMADLIDIGVTNSDVPYIINKGIQMAVCAVAALILGVGSARFSALAGQGLGANIRKAEYGKLQSYSFSNIDHFSVSSLVTRLTSDVTNIQNAVSTGMRPFGRSPVMLIFATTLAFRINSTLALVFLVALPILAVLLIIIIINVGPRYGRMQGAVDLVNRCIEENLTAVRVVKSYVHDQLGITFIYVTHDQEEALTMSDKIVVLSEGKIQQIGTPEDIYNEPKNAFVADFIGESNIFKGIMTLHKVTFPSSGSSASSIMSNILSAPESAESMKLTCCVNWFNGMALCLTYTRYADMLPRSMIPFITNIPPTQAESA